MNANQEKVLNLSPRPFASQNGFIDRCKGQNPSLFAYFALIRGPNNPLICAGQRKSAAKKFFQE
jgi:hypothetical protein